MVVCKACDRLLFRTSNNGRVVSCEHQDSSLGSLSQHIHSRSVFVSSRHYTRSESWEGGGENREVADGFCR